MSKKSSSKFSKAVVSEEDKHVVEQEKLSPLPKKTVNEIDEIFSEKKKKKRTKTEAAEQEQTQKSTKGLSVKPKKMKKKKNEKQSKGFREGFSVDTTSRPRKRTEDGLAVYTEEELGIDKADAGTVEGILVSQSECRLSVGLLQWLLCNNLLGPKDPHSFQKGLHCNS